ncbi:MAG: isoprenyl transferase [Pelosinus sp.]|nr:isoprenyl transferase [Pelosinus sp.]
MWKKWFSKKVNDENLENLYNTLDQDRIPKHIAIIMDGNGRWAQKRGMPRTFGHHAGAETLRNIVRAASDIGVQVLTTYAFSTENWKRPRDEVNLLMKLISDYLDSEIEEMNQNNVRMRFIGKLAELPQGVQDKIVESQQRTAGNTGLILNLAINYGGRAEVVHAVQIIAQKVLQGELTPDQIDVDLINRHLYTAGLPDPDLLIRPSGDLRLSNFLLWQSAYTELWLTDINWPDFTPELLVEAIKDFQKRERRFGGLKKK